MEYFFSQAIALAGTYATITNIYIRLVTLPVYFIISNFAYPPFIWSFSKDDVIHYVEITRVIDQYVDVSFKIVFFFFLYPYTLLN